jgi:hypothetical protein
MAADADRGAGRLEEFRRAYRASEEEGRRVLGGTAQDGAVRDRLRQLPPEVLAVARRVQENLLREIEAECPRGTVRRGPPAGVIRAGAACSPGDYMWRTLGR